MKNDKETLPSEKAGQTQEPAPDQSQTTKPTKMTRAEALKALDDLLTVRNPGRILRRNIFPMYFM